MLGGAISAPRGGEAGESFLAGMLSPFLLDVGVVLKAEVDGSVQKLVNFSGQKQCIRSVSQNDLFLVLLLRATYELHIGNFVYL